MRRSRQGCSGHRAVIRAVTAPLLASGALTDLVGPGSGRQPFLKWHQGRKGKLRHLTGGLALTAVATTLAAAPFLAWEGPASSTSLTGSEGLSLSAPSLYSVAHSGDVDTDPNPARGLDDGDGPSRGFSMGRSHPLGREALVLRKAFADLLDPTRQCFPRGELEDFVDPFIEGENNGFAGGITQERKNTTRVLGDYYFNAFGTDGVTSFNYRLTIGGSVTSGIFPPDPGALATIVWDATATMSTEGKGKGSKGSNEGAACVGEVAISGSVTVTGVK